MEKRITSRTLYAIDLFLRTDVGKFVQFVSIIVGSVLSFTVLLYVDYRVIVETCSFVERVPSAHFVMWIPQVLWMVFSILVDLILIGRITYKYYYKIFDPEEYVKQSKELFQTSEVFVAMMMHFGHLFFALNYFFLASDVCRWICPFRGNYYRSQNYLYASDGIFLLLLLEIFVFTAAMTFRRNFEWSKGILVCLKDTLVCLKDTLVCLKSTLVKSYTQVSDGLKEFDQQQLKLDFPIKREPLEPPKQ